MDFLKCPKCGHLTLLVVGRSVRVHRCAGCNSIVVETGFSFKDFPVGEVV